VSEELSGIPGPLPKRRVSKTKTAVPVAKRSVPGGSAIAEDELKKVFRQFDADGSGSIDAAELREAMMVLGVKCTMNAAKRVLKLIDTDGDGTIDWPEFLEFFCTVSDPESVRNLLAECNRRFLDYKQMVEEDANFSRRFNTPEILSSTQRFCGHKDNVEAVCWLSDTTFISGSIDGELLIWDVAARAKKPTPTRSIKTGLQLYSMATSLDAQTLLTGMASDSDNLWLWDIHSSDEPSQKFRGHTSPVYCSAFSPDADYVLSGSRTGKLCYHDIQHPHKALSELEAHAGVIYSCDAHSNGSLLCTASADGQVKIWDVRSPSTPKMQCLIDDAAASCSVFKALWRGDVDIVSCGGDYCIKRWDIRMIKEGPTASYFGHTSVVKSIALSPDLQFLCSAAHDGSLRIWKVDELGQLRTRHEEAQEQIAVLEEDLEGISERVMNGEEDIEVLKRLKVELQELYEECRFVESAQHERTAFGSSQAQFCLEGHKLSCGACAWREVGAKSRILGGSHDQTTSLYDLRRDVLEKVSLWDADAPV